MHFAVALGASTAVLGMATVAAAASLDTVESKLFVAREFPLQGGGVLPELRLAYESHGTLSPNGRNAVLVTHGFTSSHHAAGRYGTVGVSKGHRPGDVGFWDKLIGPGKAIDTDKLFVVSSNMLGSSYGSTSPASLNPKTGKPYGPDFPPITVGDIVRAQKLLLDSLGIKHLVAVAGPSYGGFQTFQWAVTFPDFMDGLVPVVTAPAYQGGERALEQMRAELAMDPHWNEGWYYDNGGVATVMTQMRVATLKRYGIEAQLASTFPDPVAREAAIVKAAEPWVQAFDANSLLTLRQALVSFDTTPQFKAIKAKLLYVLSRTDALFPPKIAPAVMDQLKAAGVDANYVEIDSDLGHLASGLDADKWAPALKTFVERLLQRS
jgi:homoserine O-acetyltransferase/O-succinyltransferase